MKQPMSYPREEIFAKISRILINYDIPAKAITRRADFKKNLGFDSLDMAYLILKIEIAFDIQIPKRDMDQLGTVGAAIRYVQAAKDKSV